MTTEIETVQKSDRTASHTWIGIAAAMVLSLLIVGFVWFEFHTPSTGAELDVGDVPHGGRNRTAIQAEGKNAWSVWAPPATLYVNGTPPKEFNIDLRNRGAVPDDVREVARMGMRISRDHRAAQAINATKDQLAKVRGMQLEHVVVSQSDMDNLKKLWNDYQSANDAAKPNAQTLLLNALHTTGQNSVEPTRKMWADAATLVKNTFTADQIAKYQQYDRADQQRQNQPATSQPTTRRTKPTTQLVK